MLFSVCASLYFILSHFMFLQAAGHACTSRPDPRCETPPAVCLCILRHGIACSGLGRRARGLTSISCGQVTSGRDSVYPGVQGAYYWTEDPWFNGPMRGYGRDEQHEGGIPIDAKLVQPNNVYNEYGVDMVGSFAPVNTYVYEPGWAPNAM